MPPRFWLKICMVQKRMSQKRIVVEAPDAFNPKSERDHTRQWTCASGTMRFWDIVVKAHVVEAHCRRSALS